MPKIGPRAPRAPRAPRHRSLSPSLAVVAATVAVAVAAVLAMVSATVSVAAWGMVQPSHDVSPVILVCAIAGAGSLAATLFLGAQAVAGSRAPVPAIEALGDGGGFCAPVDPPTAELAEWGPQWAATGAKLAASREHEQAQETSRRELMAWISHDLRTPLAGLRAMAEALEDGMVPDPSVYYARIRTEVERLNAMVGDLFELSRIQAGVLPLALSHMSVYDLVNDALEGADLLAREHGVRLIAEVRDPLPIEVDGHAMTRVLTNLLANAIHRTPAEGIVTVAARREADTVVLSVTDGCGGIPADDLPRVFDAGWRGTGPRGTGPRGTGPRGTGPRGTGPRATPVGAGLGLAIVRGIVEAHSGQTTVHNVAGGCRFEVVLPVARRSEAAQTESADRGPGSPCPQSQGIEHVA
jgi:signal transduction histidine kinase